jgi:hypothetical protein
VASIQCKTCDVGELVLERRYRMSGVVVAIGYILLIPSVLGILASVFFFLTTLSVSGSTRRLCSYGNRGRCVAILWRHVFCWRSYRMVAGYEEKSPSLCALFSDRRSVLGRGVAKVCPHCAHCKGSQ